MKVFRVTAPRTITIDVFLEDIYEVHVTEDHDDYDELTQEDSGIVISALAERISDDDLVNLIEQSKEEIQLFEFLNRNGYNFEQQDTDDGNRYDELQNLDYEEIDLEPYEDSDDDSKEAEVEEVKESFKPFANNSVSAQTILSLKNNNKT